MRKQNFFTAAAGIAVSTTLAFGVAAPVASATPSLPSPGIASPGFNSPGLTLPGNVQGEKIKHGGIGFWPWTADVYSQIVRGAKVYPGRTVTIRVTVQGTQGEGKIREIGHNMPSGFELLSVTRQSSDNLLGSGVYTLKNDEYVTTEHNGMKETRLSWTEGGFLGMFKDNPTVSTTKSVSVDFTYRAPETESEFNHGPYARLGAAFNTYGNWITGGQTVKVEKSPETFFAF